MTRAQHLTCTLSSTDADLAAVSLAGDLVYDVGEELLTVVRRVLALHRPAVIAVDCSALTYCDSHGLSLLLAVHRTVAAAGATLRLDDRPAFLDRLLRRTNTYHHLTTDAAPGREQRPRS
ncbi:STAS domain-containing protein [Actinosynnema sp. NPDC050436]|uniref:STAS domain-containing protein n=1 Tax=Actinosynnema sp. NPDC050436 TaxID=3155659 RepID=UPI0033E8E7E6